MMRFSIACWGWLWFAAALGGAVVSPSPYGINTHLANNADLARVVEAAIPWIRIDIDWRSCEPRKGDFRFADVDRVVDFAKNNGLSILAVLAYTPDWANAGKGPNHPADHTPDWSRFVSVTVTRYQQQIKYWSIWNEPNVPDFFFPGKDVFVSQVWKPAAGVIRKQDPGAFIVGPDLAHLTTTDQEWFLWLKYILVTVGEDIDIISHHLYDSRGGQYVFELLESGEPLIPSVKDLLSELGFAGHPFWLTETGWNTLTFSEDMQAENYLETLQLRRSRNYPDKVFFYELRDDANPEVSSWGILRSDGSAKRAFFVYKDFIAGEYAGNAPDPIPERDARDCYAERLIPSTAQSGLFAPLRRLRRDLVHQVPGGGFWVEAYSRWSRYLTQVSLQDSRLFHSGSRLIALTASLVDRPGGSFWTSPLPPGLRRTAREWLHLLLKKPMPFELRRLLRTAEKLESLFPENITPLKVIGHHRFRSAHQRLIH